MGDGHVSEYALYRKIKVTRGIFQVYYAKALHNYVLLKTGSLDNAIREFSLAKPSWYMSH